MKRRYITQAAAALALTAVAAIWLFTTSYPVQDFSQPFAENAYGPINKAHELTQDFIAPADELSRIELVLNKVDPRGTGQLHLKVYESRGSQPDGAPALGQVLAEDTLDTGGFDYLGIHRFELGSLSLTPGGKYAIRLTDDDPLDAGISIMGCDTGCQGGQLYYDGMPIKGKSYLGLYHSTDIGGLLAKIAPFHPWPLGSALLFEFLFLAGVGTFGWLLWKLAAGNGSGGPAGD